MPGVAPTAGKPDRWAARRASEGFRGWHALRYSEGRAALTARPSEYLRACHPTRSPVLWHGLLTVPRPGPKVSFGFDRETFGRAGWHGQETVPQQWATQPGRQPLRQGLTKGYSSTMSQSCFPFSTVCFSVDLVLSVYLAGMGTIFSGALLVML